MDTESGVIDRLMDPVVRCLSADVARRLVALRADADLQAHVDALADKANAGTLSDSERSEYEQYVNFSQFVALLQIKARDLLDRSGASSVTGADSRNQRLLP